MSVITLTRQGFKPLPWRTIALVAALAVLLAAAAVFVGSQRRLPAPFGVAGNGLVAYSTGGDIYTVDPDTGTRTPIVTGQVVDHVARWSLDGTRLAFLRAERPLRLDVPVIARADGTIELVPDVDPFVELDSDSVMWSPDGRTIAFAANQRDGTGRALYLLDTTTGHVRTVAPNYVSLEVFWRPPDGRELMYLGATSAGGQSLFVYSMADGSVRELPVPPGDEASLRPIGWTPDGKRFALHRSGPGRDDLFRTHVIDVATGAEAVIDAGFSKLSNDGRHVVGHVWAGDSPRLCVASTSGGPCRPIGLPSDAPGGNGAALQWSPDDRWIVSHPGDRRGPVILDPDRTTRERPSWLANGAESWQRVAP